MPTHHVFFLLCPPFPPLTLPFRFCLPLQWLLSSPLLPSLCTPADKAGGESSLWTSIYWLHLYLASLESSYHNGCARSWLSNSISFKSTETEVCFSALYRNSCCYGQRKEKGNCRVICLEKVAKLSLLCALMLTKFHEICLEIRMGVNTHLNFNVWFDILP